MAKDILPQSRLKELLNYCPATGIFTRKVSSKGSRAGDVAGSITNRGYMRIWVATDRYLAHRLAFLYVYGEMPEQIDHINHDRLDNRISNLRAANKADNCRNRSKALNNKSGVTGVHWEKKCLAWEVRIGVDGETKRVGYFKDLLSAACARKSAERKYGYHQNHGG